MYVVEEEFGRKMGVKVCVCVKFLIRGKLAAKGRRGMSEAEVAALVAAWREIGVDIEESQLAESKPALYLFFKILLNSLWSRFTPGPYTEVGAKALIFTIFRKIIMAPLRVNLKSRFR